MNKLKVIKGWGTIYSWIKFTLCWISYTLGMLKMKVELWQPLFLLFVSYGNSCQLVYTLYAEETSPVDDHTHFYLATTKFEI